MLIAHKPRPGAEILTLSGARSHPIYLVALEIRTPLVLASSVVPSASPWDPEFPLVSTYKDSYAFVVGSS